MFRHNLIIALRNLFKYRLQSAIGILSVALGMVFCSLTVMWIRYERKYDSFYRDVDDIYLVMRKDPALAGQDFKAYTSYPEGDYLSERYPQIEKYTRCQINVPSYTVYNEGKETANLVGMAVDSNFRDFFDVKVLEGDYALNLSQNEVALTRTQAHILYGGGDAVGNMLYTNQGAFYIKAVIEDPMKPTSIPYDFVVGIDEDRYSTRLLITTELFVRVNKENVTQLAREIECDTASFHHTQTMDNGALVNWTENYVYNYRLLPILKVREEGVLDNEAVKLNVKLRYVYILMILGLVLTVCSLANYFTLFVTRMRMRMREISLRYANGSGMIQFVTLFSTEIILFLLLSMLTGGVICTFALPYFRELSMMDISVPSYLLSYLLYAAVIGVISILVSSVFIWMVSRRQLARYLGNNAVNAGTALGYKVSIGFQLAVSICAIFCSVIISRQINHLLQSRDMGYRKHNVGYCYQFGMTESDVVAAREKLRMLPELDKVVYGFDPTNGYRSYSSIQADTLEDSDNIRIVMIKASRDYLDLIEVEPVAGELFGQEEPENSVIINETLANLLGGADGIVGKYIYSYYTPYLVKGVIKDLCNLDPRNETVPLVYEYRKEGNASGVNLPNYFIFTYKEGVKWNELDNRVLESLREIRPDATYHTLNMEQDYMEFIKSENMLAKLLMIITVICMIVAVSGLYSIVSLLCQKRRKEIAVRKINGARMSDILRMFIREYLPIIILSAIAAFTVGTAVMLRWLSTYVRQTPLTVWVYLSVFACMIVIIGLTVFGNIRRAMTENPADVIKSE